VSLDLYPVRVFCEPNKPFCVKTPGVHRQMAIPPSIKGLPEFIAIDYAPHVVAEIQEETQQRREMYAREVAALKAWLEVQK
jgi:hypothetical protein